jgi:hypothetical protein
MDAASKIADGSGTEFRLPLPLERLSDIASRSSLNLRAEMSDSAAAAAFVDMDGSVGLEAASAIEPAKTKSPLAAGIESASLKGFPLESEAAMVTFVGLPSEPPITNAFWTM